MLIFKGGNKMSILTDMGIGCPSGLSVSDKTRLVQIVNNANSNNDTIRNNIISVLNNKFKVNLSATVWADIITFINNMNLGDATPSDVVKDKIFSSNSGITQKGTLDFSIYKRNASGSFYTTTDMEVNNLI